MNAKIQGMAQGAPLVPQAGERLETLATDAGKVDPLGSSRAEMPPKPEGGRRSRDPWPKTGITRKIALLSWLVTIGTLGIFVLVLVPEQQRTFLENLESKARGISASLQDVTAGAVVSEDYSSVVEHCKQVLQGDPSIHFLVITKNDGFSLIHQTGGAAPVLEGVAPRLAEARWHTDTLKDRWVPVTRKPQRFMDDVPLFHRRLFHYAKPFDYSGIEWGWIHVGLSLESYERSVEGVYRRTGILGLVCLVLSLGVSVNHARRLVRPLHELSSVVNRVTSGDLAARATIVTGDEIQELAQSFNTMTTTLQHRDQILQSVRFAAQQFLRAGYSEQVIVGVLERLRRSANANRVYVYGNAVRQGPSFRFASAFEVADDGVAGSEVKADGVEYVAEDPAQLSWIEVLAEGESIRGLVATLPRPWQLFFGNRRILSLCLMPVFVEHQWWGLIGFEQGDYPRTWSEAELDSLRAAADMLGAAIERKQNQDALLQAKLNLEERVRQRTRELEQQVSAKERAMAELAETQQRLVETSRQAGMAEVATGVLHNVGNVLNSVNVSVNLLQDQTSKSKITNFQKTAALLAAHATDLAGYLTVDPKGRMVPEYLMRLSDHLVAEQGRALTELKSLAANVEHIKEIVAMQQSYGRVSGMLEALPPVQLVEDALRINEAGLQRHGVRLVCNFDTVPPVLVDKHKVLQILINLIRNAKHALDAFSGQEKCLMLGVSREGDGPVRVSVRDNGIGIPQQNLTRIFSHGFTTKKDGHGFGLHSGALAAKEMGGTLRASSDGEGKGATFTLELPVAPERNGSNGAETGETEPEFERRAAV